MTCKVCKVQLCGAPLVTPEIPARHAATDAHARLRDRGGPAHSARDRAGVAAALAYVGPADSVTVREDAAQEEATAPLEHEIVGYDATLDVLLRDEWRRDAVHATHARCTS